MCRLFFFLRVAVSPVIFSREQLQCPRPICTIVFRTLQHHYSSWKRSHESPEIKADAGEIVHHWFLKRCDLLRLLHNFFFCCCFCLNKCDSEGPQGGPWGTPVRERCRHSFCVWLWSNMLVAHLQTPFSFCLGHSDGWERHQMNSFF